MPVNYSGYSQKNNLKSLDTQLALWYYSYVETITQPNKVTIMNPKDQKSWTKLAPVPKQDQTPKCWGCHQPHSQCECDKK